jgi:hypothetical protein
MREHHRSFPQTSGAIERLVSAEVLSQVGVGRRNRVFEAPAIINAFTDLERQLASPPATLARPALSGRYRPAGQVDQTR